MSQSPFSILSVNDEQRSRWLAHLISVLPACQQARSLSKCVDLVILFLFGNLENVDQTIRGLVRHALPFSTCVSIWNSIC